MFSFFSRGAENTKTVSPRALIAGLYLTACYSPIDFLSSYMENILFKIKNVKNIVDPINETMC